LKLTAFFFWNGAVMLLERPIGRVPESHHEAYPDSNVSTLVVFTAGQPLVLVTGPRRILQRPIHWTVADPAVVEGKQCHSQGYNVALIFFYILHLKRTGGEYQYPKGLHRKDRPKLEWCYR
jgi:hypothetical protein